MRIAALLLVSLAAPWAAAADRDAKPLSGTYAFVGRTPVDPPPGEPRDSHLLLVLDGAAAQDLYRKMKGPAKRDACLDDGSLSKTSGNMQCTALAKARGHTCSFAIDLAAQKIERGSVC